jgi:DNA-binding GntR family transcriptional regulator
VATFVADSLEQSILNGQIAPGTPLLQLDLAGAFGVSRVPVRDALAILEQRDLAVRVPRKGVIGRPITAQSVRDVSAVRRLLEAEAVRLAGPRLTLAALARLEETVDAQRRAVAANDQSAARHADHDFHSVIWQECGNEVLHDLLASVWRRALQARSYGQRSPGWGERFVARHERILAALRQGDAAHAVAAAMAAVDAAEAETLAQLPAPQA